MLKAGRGVAVIAFDGSFERRWTPARLRASKYDDRYRLWMRHWRQELGRTIDYLATRKDVDAGRLGCYAFSMGASRLSTLLAVEKRIGAAVLYSGGTDVFAGLPMSEQPFNYFPRITQPVLMLNGRFDMVFPTAGQQRMLELLGAPPEQKKRVVFEGGHVVLPRFQVQQLSLEWFDTYLGPAQPRGTTQ